MNPAALTAQHVDEAFLALGRLRESWPWLAEMLSPDVRITRPRRPATPDELTTRGRAHVSDRQVMLANARQGLKQRGPQPDAARIGVVSARVQVATDLVRLVNELSEELRGYTPTWPNQEAVWRASDPCDRCEGTGYHPEPTPTGVWPGHRPCPRCLGRRRVCRLCHTAGGCACGRMDACVAVALDRLPDLLHTTAAGLAHEQAQHTARRLERADRIARSACGLTEDRRALTAPCPACDRYELHAEITSPVHAEWTVVCMAPDCLCTPGCTCGRANTHLGSRHLWPARLWAGPRGLAAILGVEHLVTQAVQDATREHLHRRLTTALHTLLEARRAHTVQP